MGDKEVSQEQIEVFIKELGSDATAYITMGQLQHLVNKKNSAEARIQELEAQVDRLRDALITCHDAHDYFYADEQEVLKAIDSTPGQSLEAVKREAVIEALECFAAQHELMNPANWDINLAKFIDKIKHSGLNQ